MRRYLMNFDTRKLNSRKTDCLVVGGGVTGLVAAWHAAAAGLNVTLMVKDTIEDSNTNKAQGGIAAVFGADDSFDLHVEDTLVAGAGLCDEEIVRIVVEEGRAEVKHLIELGAVFDRDENGLSLGREGCHCRNRILHAKGDATGAEVVRAMLAAVRRAPRVTIAEHMYLVDLLTHEGECRGALVLDKKENRLEMIRAGAVVLATGGVGRLFVHTTNPEGALGNGIAAAYRAGAAAMDMEFVQFHPTALALPDAPNFLISEAVRGAGGVLRNDRGERFMPRYHALADLAPRDIVARAIYNEMKTSGKNCVQLDLSGIETEEIRRHFPMIARTCLSYGIDIVKETIPVAPAAHYMMGGVAVNPFGETRVRALYAGGETACTGLHGANRLASNSLLEGLAFGRRIAADIAAKKRPFGGDPHFSSQGLREDAAAFAGEDDAVRRLMNDCLGLIRDADGLNKTRAALSGRIKATETVAARSAAELDYLNMLETCALIAAAADMRAESRGGHFRADYPEASDLWRKHIIQKQ